jgi:hypothetical protein
MATRLKKIKVNEVSLVSRPAIAKEFLLFKSEDGSQEEPVMVEEIQKEEQPVEEVAKAEPEPVLEQAIDTMKEAEDVEKGKDKKSKDKPKPVKKEEAEPEIEKAKMEACKECKKMYPVEKLEDGVCKGCAKPVKKEEEPLSKEAELAKQLEEERVQKEALMKEIEDLKKQAFLAKEAEITKEYIEKASIDMKHVPNVSAAVFGPVLKHAAEKLEKGDFDAIYGALKAANDYIKSNSVLTKELGVGGEDLSAAPHEQLEAIAKSLQDKDSSLTHAKAYQLACEKNPQIYAEHVRNARRG